MLWTGDKGGTDQEDGRQRCEPQRRAEEFRTAEGEFNSAVWVKHPRGDCDVPGAKQPFI